MIHIIPSHTYRHKTSGMVVEAVIRHPYESNLMYFPGVILLPGRSGRWDIVGRRLSRFHAADFEPVRRIAEPQLTMFSKDGAA